MATICPYCAIEISESAIEAEDGCCPECGAVLAVRSLYDDNEDPEFDEDMGLEFDEEEEDEFSEFDEDGFYDDEFDEEFDDLELDDDKDDF